LINSSGSINNASELIKNQRAYHYVINSTCKGLETHGLCHNKKTEPEFSTDQSGIDEEIDHPIAATDSSQNQWKTPTSINLKSYGLC
jgi:hypothetical protein